MKLPYPVTPARATETLPFRWSHIIGAILVLPAVAGAAYIITRIILSLPTP